MIYLKEARGSKHFSVQPTYTNSNLSTTPLPPSHDPNLQRPRKKECKTKNLK